jgi:protein-S-isoprenylcysteine O-methyltransferase Ste14
MFYHWLFFSLFLMMWGGWLAVWNVMARRVKEAAQTEGPVSRLSHIVPLLIAACLLVARVPLPLLNNRFAPLAIWPAALGAALTFAGLAFCFWARFVIADNWSSDVQLKRDHELIVDGPYRWVRHPIYTGLLLAFIGARRACGRDRGPRLLAQAATRRGRHAPAVRRDLRRYAASVPALIPFV